VPRRRHDDYDDDRPRGRYSCPYCGSREPPLFCSSMAPVGCVILAGAGGLATFLLLAGVLLVLLDACAGILMLALGVPPAFFALLGFAFRERYRVCCECEQRLDL
jgi:hypothetical protein